MRKIIVLEVNELPYKVYDRYVDKNPNCLLAQIFNHSTQYITKSTDEGELHPWSTWPTFYRGIDNAKHKIKDIGEDLTERNKMYPPLWEILTQHNISAGIFASLHTYPLPSDLKNYKFLVPDPFALGSTTFPKKIEPFQAFNLAMTRRSGRSVDKSIDKRSALKLMFALPGLGLRISTILITLKQLVNEKFASWKASRRRTFQSVLAFDLFIKLLRNNKPQFVTFFSNHVASAMHRYWAATFPEDYTKNDLPKKWINRYKFEIDYCMDHLNRMLISMHKFLKKNPEYLLVVASSMGQEATKAEMVTHELFLDDFNKLQDAIGVELEPLTAMHPQYNFAVNGDADLMETRLRLLSLNGDKITYRRKDNIFFSIDLGYPNVTRFEAKFEGRQVGLEDLGMKIKAIDDQSGGTAYHIPEGSFFIYDINNQDPDKERKEVDLRVIAPSILKYYHVEAPKYMIKNGLIPELIHN
ncbi:hypothetical protein [Ekhidna sp.]|uniref:hypothetical protein n=1 Tax=Ekhidna sp. TaxID=2608089 RepID=UPI003298CBF4